MVCELISKFECGFGIAIRSLGVIGMILLAYYSVIIYVRGRKK